MWLDVERFDSPRARWCTWTALSIRASSKIVITRQPGDDCAEVARIYELLAARFGEDSVFLDTDLFPLGSGSRDSIEVYLSLTEAVLVVIGRRWLDELLAGHYPLHADVVAAALDRGVLVIPVLVGRARMPSQEDLPIRLAPLAQIAAVRAAEHDDDQLIHHLTAGMFPPAVMVPRGPLAKSVELEHMLVRAARAGVFPAADRLIGMYDLAPLPPPATLPSQAPGRMAERRPRRLWAWRALGLAALAAGGYLIVDRLLGLVLESLESTAPTDDVVCTVFAPPMVTPGESFLVQAFVHLPEQADDARALAFEMDTEAVRRVFRSLEAPIPRGGRLHFELRAPGLIIDDPVTSLVWRGRPEAVQFGVSVPPGGVIGPVIATLSISLDSAPLGHVKFKTTVDSPSAASLPSAAGAESEPQGELARRYRAAFISYASKDRDKVLQRVQMLPLVGVRYFQDLLNLDPGDRWLRRLELGIDECDLFLLFWSSEAKSSEWVRQEVRYALERRGGDDLAAPEIKPVIIEGPPVVEPWEELADLHFNDRVLYFMNR